MEMTVDLFDSIINTSQDCVFWKDKNRRFLGVNQAFLDYYGFKSADVLIGKNDEEMGWHSDPDPYMQDELRVLSGKTTYKVQGKCFIRGEERDIIASKRPLYNGDEIVGLVGSFVDITDVIRRKEKNDGSQVLYTIDKLRKYSFFDKIVDEISLSEILDPLTGILSRSYAMKFVRSLIASKTPFTFTIIDLDNFKFINDTYGHDMGDRVLANIAEVLRDSFRSEDHVCRIGGDEFAAIMIHVGPQFTDMIRAKVERINQKLLNPSAGLAPVSVSVGVAFYNSEHSTGNLIKDADVALYRVKEMGRCGVAFYEQCLPEAAQTPAQS